MTEDVRAVAMRLLSIPGGYPVTQFRAGALPDAFPREIPLPPESRILGGFTSDIEVRVAVDTGLTPEATLRFYRDRLPSVGWEAVDTQRAAGFADVLGRKLASVVFCRGGRGPSLRIMIQPGFEVATELRLHFELWTAGAPCADQGPLFTRLIPRLVPPPGTQQKSEGGGGGGSRAHMSATLETELTLSSVAKHYEAQLGEAGWSRTNAGECGPLAWSTWQAPAPSKTEPAYHGWFFVLAQPGKEGCYLLTARVQREGNGID